MSSALTLADDLAVTLKAARDARLQTQQEAAREIGCSVRALQEWERGSGTRTIPQTRYRRALIAYFESAEVAA